jgi:DNA modification methylase
MNGLRLEWIDPKTLTPNPKNWRRHPEHQRDALADVLGEVGWAGAALYNEQTGKLVDGHLRLDVALRRGDEAKILATLDPISALATADAAALDSLLREVNTGSAAVMDMLAELAEGAGLYPEPVVGAGGDEFDTTPDDGPTRAQRGDLWQMGEHRLLVDDCTVAANVARLMGGERAQMVFTDPPWNVAIGQDSNPRHRQRAGLQNDDLSAEDFAAFLAGFASNIAEALDGDLYCVLGASEWGTLDLTLRKAGFHWSATIIWVKDQFVLGRSKYHRRYEPIWYGWAKDKRSSFGEARDLDDVWEIDRPRVSEEHPTMKPVELVQRAVENSSQRGSTVLDPFLGSGTTLIAAERLGRKCYGCEIEPRYADVILRRWEAETGREAALVERGEAVELGKVGI